MQGMTDYLPVLSSLSSLQKLERSIFQRWRERLSQRLLLYRVLGGSLLDTASAQLPSPTTNQ
jgi:hypothetical protein